MLSTTTKNGITCNVDDNKRTRFSGTSTATAIFIFQNYNDSRLFKPGTYTLSIANKPPSSNSFIRLEFSKDKSTAYSFANIYGASANKFVTFTLKEEGYLKVSLAIESDVTINNLDLTPQLEIGEIASDIVANEEQSMSFPMQDGQVLREGDYPADDGTHHIRKQIVLDGTENWFKSSISTVNRFGLSNTYFSNITSLSADNTLCTHFKYESSGNSLNTYKFLNTTMYFDTSITTLEEWKSWLATQKEAGTPLILEYVLAEEEIVPYNEAQQTAYNKMKELETYRNVTNVFCTDEISCEFDTEYYKDLATMFTNQNQLILGGN